MEQSIGNASATVLNYSMQTSQWVEMGSESGICSISLLKSPSNEYRFVAWKDSNQEIVLNSFLFPTMQYDSTTPTFHQWYDESRLAHGLNFINSNEAKKFGIAVGCALEALNEAKSIKPASDFARPTKMVLESIPKTGPVVSPYATTSVTLCPNNNSTRKEPAVPVVKTSSSAPPPPGPPPAAPPPPGPPPPGPAPPSGPSAPSNKSIPANDFASQLKAASQNIKSSTNSTNVDNISSDTVTSVKEPTSKPSASGGPMDFLSELKMRSQKRTTEGAVSVKKNETYKAPVVSSANLTAKTLTNQSSKLSASTSDLSTSSVVTMADLEKFRTDLMKDILLNMEKMKNEIISSISAKLN